MPYPGGGSESAKTEREKDTSYSRFLNCTVENAAENAFITKAFERSPRATFIPDQSSSPFLPTPTEMPAVSRGQRLPVSFLEKLNTSNKSKGTAYPLISNHSSALSSWVAQVLRTCATLNSAVNWLLLARCDTNISHTPSPRSEPINLVWP